MGDATTEDAAGSTPIGSCGFIYVLSNPAIPGLLKIGCTRTSPFQRADELFTTGVPERFVVSRAWYVLDCVACEATIHNALADARSAAGSREFFKVELATVCNLVHDLLLHKLVPEVYASSESDQARAAVLLREKAALAEQLQNLQRSFEEATHRIKKLEYQCEELRSRVSLYGLRSP